MSSAKPVSTFVKALIDDEKFIKSIEDNIKEIIKDGKVTAGDIPEIVAIVTGCYNNMSKFNLTYEELPEVLVQIVNYIIETYNLIPDDEEEEFKRMIDTAVKLIMLQPKIKKGVIFVWKKIKSVLTCSCCKKQN
jgi:hypothetical protein|tara:strand:- start:131 stop:532 length:402 start_codon:yes stop_codon:yes gene_type:complete